MRSQYSSRVPPPSPFPEKAGHLGLHLLGAVSKSRTDTHLVGSKALDHVWLSFWSAFVSITVANPWCRCRCACVSFCQCGWPADVRDGSFGPVYHDRCRLASVACEGVRRSINDWTIVGLEAGMSTSLCDKSKGSSQLSKFVPRDVLQA